MARATTAPADTTTRPALWTLRVTATLVSALFVAQGLTGGEYLVGNTELLDLHGTGAIAIHVLTGVQTLGAALLWRATRGPWWPTAVSAAVFALSLLQAQLGGGDTLDSHVPLAIVLLVGVMVVVSWAWSRRTR